jgi:glutathione S-transferase
MMVPYLVDPNTGRSMFESADIVAYLNETYAVELRHARDRPASPGRDAAKMSQVFPAASGDHFRRDVGSHWGDRLSPSIDAALASLGRSARLRPSGRTRGHHEQVRFCGSDDGLGARFGAHPAVAATRRPRAPGRDARGPDARGDLDLRGQHLPQRGVLVKRMTMASLTKDE